MNLTRYQWTVLFAAWLGWGFDIFDGLLFNYVAPNCVPTLLHLTIGSPEAKSATLYWTGLITSVLLLGWAFGGIVFGYVADRIGRVKTLLLTMLLYAIGTASCALAPNIEVLLLCRIIASLGIGGEWAAGASMVAEVMPEKYRIEAGALLYTSAPMGLFLATFVNSQIAGVLFHDSPETSWRYVFLAGLIPAVVAFTVRFFIKEPEAWEQEKEPSQFKEIFAPGLRKNTLSGLLMAVIALLTWWSSNAFIPVVASGLAQAFAKSQSIPADHLQATIEQWKTTLTNSFNIGGLIGTLLTIPAAKILGRKWMFVIYFALSSLAVTFTFGSFHSSSLEISSWAWLYFAIGLTVFGVFGSFTFYLPELFPTRLRATGAGFCYNAGRTITAIGPFLVGQIASNKANVLQGAFGVLFLIGFIPLIGIVLMPWVLETKNRQNI